MDFKNNVNGIDTSLNTSTKKDVTQDFSFDTKKAEKDMSKLTEQIKDKTHKNTNNSDDNQKKLDEPKIPTITIDGEISKLFIKVKQGKDLSQDEIDYLSKKNPAIRAIAARVIRDEEIFKRSIKNATTKEEIMRLRATADASHQETIREAEKKNLINEEEGLIINGLL